MDSHDIKSSALHVYHPLQGPNNIRVMILEPAFSPDADLHISFDESHYSNHEGEYEAISYTWGEPNLTHPIYVDGTTRLLITANLDVALRRLRLSDKKRRLWADAVCINQSDEKEKATQIPLMVHVFRGARQVLAWLGQRTGEEIGLKLLERWSRLRPKSLGDIHKDLRTEEDEEADLRHIFRFLSLPWFSRLWIIQEVVFNLDVVLISGASELSWIRLMKVLPTLRAKLNSRLHFVGRQSIDALERISRLWKYHCEFGNSWDESSREPVNTENDNKEDIVGIVGEFWNHGCTNPRDRIFALYNMTSDITPMPLAEAPESCETNLPETPQEDIEQHQSRPIFMDIDYSLDVQQTHQTFAKACAAAGRLSGILNAVLARQYSPAPRHWPSWVPDWRLQPATTVPLSPTAISLLRRISETCLEIDVNSPGGWNHRAIDSSRQAAPHFHIESNSSSSRATAERLLSHVVELYRIICLSDEDFTPGGLATVIKSTWPLMRNVDPVLLTNCLTKPWDNGLLRNSTFLLQQDKRLARQLQEALRGQSFFTATASKSEHTLTMHGFGNTEMEPGDRVIPIWKGHMWNMGHDLEENDSLILRPSGERFEGETIYRLIGSASVFAVFMQGRLKEPKGNFRIRILLE